MRAATDRWTPADIPDQTGRTVLVTGTTVGGLGQFTALELARRGAHVILAGRREERIAETRAAILDEVPDAELDPLVVDLADLSSVRRAAAEAAGTGPLHLLVNNAGVMAPPYRRTADGFELQLATNHLGPFLLTGLLLPQLAASEGATVVTVSSQMHRIARRAPLDDPRSAPGRYHRWPVYGQTKLANLLFTYELDRRLRAAEAAGQGAGRAPRLRLDAPGRERPVRPRDRRARVDPGRRDQGRLAQHGRRGRVADADGGDGRPAGRDLRRARRPHGVGRLAEGHLEQRAVVRRGRPAAAVAGQRGRHRPALPVTRLRH